MERDFYNYDDQMNKAVLVAATSSSQAHPNSADLQDCTSLSRGEDSNS
ncbi:hypothetical protein [Acidithrix sp. C25]|nr:hypothetical protein [Acidithrix sp. C25]CAG4921273.1 unnamed protein product [Acidithrix sp. C25]